MSLRAWLLTMGLLCAATALRAAEDENPHWMLRPDGEPDEEKCAICHNEDMDLLSSKEETCLSCHDRTLHSGSVEHLRAAAVQVQRRLPSKEQSGVEFPLAEDGRMYCGTCHLFHDPRVAEETLAPPRSLPEGGLAARIRQETEGRAATVLRARPEVEAQISFAPKSTGFLRLPIDENQLCIACHRKEAGR